MLRAPLEGVGQYLDKVFSSEFGSEEAASSSFSWQVPIGAQKSLLLLTICSKPGPI